MVNPTLEVEMFNVLLIIKKNPHKLGTLEEILVTYRPKIIKNYMIYL